MERVTNVRCCGQKQMLGVAEPVFSWWLDSDRRFVKQYRYEIQVALDENFEEVIWNYHRISDDMCGIPYMGPALESKTRYYLRVRVWTDEENRTEWSESTYFETSILDNAQWEARWIRPSVVEMGGHKDCRKPYVAEKRFALSGAVKEARLYMTCLGVYSASLNGKKVSGDYFRPGFTDYNYRLQYQTYDVGELLSQENTLKITVGEGWYSGYFGWEGRKDNYGTCNGLLAQLEIRYEDGRIEKIVTDGSWVQKYGEILYSDLYDGEGYDFREKERACGCMREFSYPFTTLEPQEGPAVRCVEEVSPKRIFKDASGRMVLDMGQNMVGWVRFRNLHTENGSVRLLHGEVLDRDGNFYNANLRNAQAADSYVLEVNDGKEYEPHFTYHGFRYVLLEGFTEDVVPEDFTGVVLSSDMEVTGELVTGDESLNRLQENICRGQRGNFFDIPTDCPQRDERQGWTADAQIILSTAAFNFDVSRFYRKWLKDVESSQKEQEGAASYVVPDILNGYFSEGKSVTAAGWGDAAVICPWQLYERYGDKGILEKQYDSMKAWVDYIRREGENEYLWDTGVQLGDWLALDSAEDSFYGATDGTLAATAYYAYSTELFARTAKVLGRMSDYKEYHDLHEKILEEFRRNFLQDGVLLTSDTQTAYVLALQFHLLRQEEEETAASRLAELLRRNNNHLDTGFLGTPYICHVLTEHGYNELAYELLFHRDFPSWLYQVDQGATTMWEHWDSRKVDGSFWSTDMNSFNHYAYGSVGNWMYRVIGGLDWKEPGYKKSVIAPKPDARVKSAECSLKSPYGLLKCQWSLENKHLFIRMVVPANTRSLIVLPEPVDEGALKAQIQTATEGTAFYTDGTIPETVGSLFEGSYRAAKSKTEREIQIRDGIAFEVGSGTFEFSYEMK